MEQKEFDKKLETINEELYQLIKDDFAYKLKNIVEDINKTFNKKMFIQLDRTFESKAVKSYKIIDLENQKKFQIVLSNGFKDSSKTEYRNEKYLYLNSNDYNLKQGQCFRFIKEELLKIVNVDKLEYKDFKIVNEITNALKGKIDVSDYELNCYNTDDCYIVFSSSYDNNKKEFAISFDGKTMKDELEVEEDYRGNTYFIFGGNSKITDIRILGDNNTYENIDLEEKTFDLTDEEEGSMIDFISKEIEKRIDTIYEYAVEDDREREIEAHERW